MYDLYVTLRFQYISNSSAINTIVSTYTHFSNSTFLLVPYYKIVVLTPRRVNLFYFSQEYMRII